MSLIVYAATRLLSLISLAILVYCVLTWVAPTSSVRYWLEQVVGPIVAPFRGISRAITSRLNLPVDLSCWLAMIAISLLSRLLVRLLVF